MWIWIETRYNWFILCLVLLLIGCVTVIHNSGSYETNEIESNESNEDKDSGLKFNIRTDVIKTENENIDTIKNVEDERQKKQGAQP